MTIRRRLIFSTPVAAASLPLASALLTQSPAAQAATAFSEAELVRQMTAKLTQELSDAPTAATEVGYINDLFLNWMPASIAASQVSSILVVGFGGRASGTGATTQVVSGPVNALIAATAYQLYQIKPVTIYAQAEVASILLASYGLDSTKVKSVQAAAVSATGAITFASLDKVVSSAVTAAGSAAAMGKVAVVTHHDLSKRAVQVATAAGLSAAVVQEVALPIAFDVQGLPAANRRRDLFLLNEIVNQFAMLRTNLIAQLYPNG